MPIYVYTVFLYVVVDGQTRPSLRVYCGIWNQRVKKKITLKEIYWVLLRDILIDSEYVNLSDYKDGKAFYIEDIQIEIDF